MTLPLGGISAFLELKGLGAFEAGLTGAQGSLDLTGKSATGMGVKIDAATASASRSTDKLRAAQLRATAAQERYNALLAQGSASTGKLAAAEASLISANTRVAASQDALNAAMARGAVEADGKLALGMRNASKAIAGAGGEMLNLARSIVPVQSGLGLAAAAFAATGVVAIRAASQFQTEVTKIHTQAGATNAEVRNLSQGMLGLAGSVATVPKTLAEAGFHIESVGLRGKQALDVMKIAAQGAKLGGADLVDVTNALDAAIVAGIPGVENYSQAMGALNATVGAGDMTMQDLADALGTGVLAVIKQYGVTLGQASAALATFGDNNIRGADAGTALRQAVIALTNPAKTAGSALEQLGLKGDGAFSHFAHDMQKGGLDAALKDLNDRLIASGNTGAKTGQILTEVFGKKAGVGLSILIGQYARYQQKEEEVQQGAKGFAAAWKDYTKTFSFAADAVKAEASALGVELGQKLLPAATAAMHWIGTTGVQDLKIGGRAFAEIAGQLAPFGYALHEVWTLGLDVGRALAPLGKIVGGLGFGAAFAAASAFGEGLRLLGDGAHLLDDAVKHLQPELIGLVAALVAVKGASAISGEIGLLTTRIGLAKLAAKEAGATMKGQLVGGLSSLVSPAGLATLAIGGLTAAVIWGIQNQHKAAAAAKAWAKSLEESTDPSNYKSLTLLNAAYDKSQGTLEANTKKLTALNEQLRATAATNPKVKDGTESLNEALRNAASQYDANKTKLGGLNSALKDSTKEQAALNAKWNEVAQTVGVTASQAYILAQKYGLDLNGTTKDLTASLKDHVGAAAQATASGKDLAGADLAAGDAMSSASDAANALSNALKGLNGDQIDATEQQNNLTQSIADMAKQLATGSRSLDKNTAAGAKNQNVLLDMFKAAEQVAVAQVQAGGSAEAASKQYLANAAAIEAQGIKAGLSKAQIDELLKSNDLIPDKVVTEISNNAPDAKSQLDPYVSAMQWLAAHPNLKTDFTFVEHGYAAGMTPQQIEESLAAKYSGYAVGGDVVGPGTGTSDSILARLSNGEYVVPADAARKHHALLEAITKGLPGFARGGSVGAVAAGQGDVFTPGFLTRYRTASAAASGIAAIHKQGIGFITDIENAVRKGGAAVASTAQTVAKQVAQSYAGTAFAAEVGAGNAALQRAATARARIAAGLAAANQQLATLAKSYASELASVSSSITGSANVASDRVLSGSDVVANLQAKVSSASAFAGRIEALRKAGLDTTQLNEIVQAGAGTGGQTAAAILSGTPAQIKATVKQLNSLQSQLAAAGNSAGHSVADAMYRTGLNAAEGLVNGLTSQQAMIDRAMANIANSLVAQIRRELGIHSPSTVMHELGAFTAQGFVNGIGSKASDANAAMAAVIKLPSRRSMASSGGAFARDAGASDQLAEVIRLLRKNNLRPTSVTVHEAIDAQATAMDVARRMAAPA